MTSLRILPFALAFAAGNAIAGTADVKFIAPDRFTDLGTYRSDERGTMDALAAHIQRLAARLPADQVLRVDVLDVDLTGYPRMTRHGNVRVNNGLADAPRIHLRYTLEARGQLLRSGEESLTSLDYTRHNIGGRDTGGFYYEKRLLSDWFARQFEAQSQASR